LIQGTKRKRSAKASGEPKAKRAPSSFILFSQANRGLAKSENADASFTDVGKILGVMWSHLSEAEKQTWKDAAAAGAAGAEEAAGDETESSDGEEEAADEEAATNGNAVAAEENGAEDA
jgi:hypothetical protein